MTERGTPAAGAALLAICANPDADHHARLAALTAGGWEDLLNLATGQRTVPLVRRAAERAGAEGAMPAGVRHALRQWHLLAARTMLAQQQTLARALAVLRTAGMEPVALKGVALAHRDYPDPALRPMRDFDLLLTPAEAERAQQALIDAGPFVPDAGEAYGIEYGHQLPELVDPGTGTLIEIHHRLNARGWAEEPVLTAQIRARAAPITVGQAITVAVPAPHDNFLHLAEHATLHHLFDNGPLVLADLHFAAAGEGIVWPVLLGEAEELGLTRALRLVAAVALAHGADWPPDALRGDPVDPGDVALAEEALLRSDTERRQLARLRRLELRTGARPGWRAGLRAALSPGARGLAEAAGTSSDNPLRALAYPLWLARRIAAYAGAGDAGLAATESSRQVRLHRWLHGD